MGRRGTGIASSAIIIIVTIIIIIIFITIASLALKLSPGLHFHHYYCHHHHHHLHHYNYHCRRFLCSEVITKYPLLSSLSFIILNPPGRPYPALPLVSPSKKIALYQNSLAIFDIFSEIYCNLSFCIRIWSKNSFPSQYFPCLPLMTCSP